MFLHYNCGMENIVFDAESVIFGNPNFDNLLNELVLLGKRLSFRTKLEKGIPSVNHFIYLVKLYYKIDRYNPVKNQTQLACEKRWV